MSKAKVFYLNPNLSHPQHSNSDSKAKDLYSNFDQLDGNHPWQTYVPEGFILYSVRELKKGKIAYFNFKLAKEMGLLDVNHPEVLNPDLEKKILKTFNLRIINEYDVENKKKYPANTIKTHKYMATRYLQLQHPNKKGETSGDGRCIWNGVVTHKGETWDVSSRGTGVTALAPGVVFAGKPLQSGNIDHGYGCGLAEIDELYSATIMAEILHLRGIETERILATIDLGGNVGIGVRAGKNLLRPAHLFMYLKQNNYAALKRATDYLIDRQVSNKVWKIQASSKSKYSEMLKELVNSFAKFVAQLEREYIFTWLDWDGDNVLANAGIIDYGSIRQFGLRHDQYRYDDVERLSTNLNEQSQKAKLIIQVFIQLVDFLESKNKKNLKFFNNHPFLKEFENIYEKEKHIVFLKQLGFKPREIKKIYPDKIDCVIKFMTIFEKLEGLKTKGKTEKVADGVNRPAILNMKKYTQFVLKQLNSNFWNPIDPTDVFFAIVSESAAAKDKKPNLQLLESLSRSIEAFKDLILSISTPKNLELLNSSLYARIKINNQVNKVTGNALLHIVDEIITQRKRGLAHSEIQKVIDNFICSQIPFNYSSGPLKKKNLSKKQSKSLMHTIQNLVLEYEEDI